MEDDVPVPFIKKRTKVRPSGSTSSLREASDSPAAASPSSLSFAAGEGDDDEGNVAVIRKPKKKTPVGVVRSREAGGAGKSRLSFGADGEEEEDDTTVVKRSTDSPRRLLRAPAPSSSASQPPTSLAQATMSGPSTSSTPSIYSKEYLDQLKATQRSAPPPPAASSSNGGRAGEYDALTLSKFGDQIDDLPSEIPTEARIAEAREKRERMRREGGGTGSDGFISLEVGFARKGGESRLVREEDELGDGDEHLAAYTESRDTLPLGHKANKAAADRMRSGMIEMIQDVGDDIMDADEEQMGWEEAQISRGEQRKHLAQEPTKQTYRPTPIPTASTLPSIGSVTSRLEEALREAKANHAMDSAALSHFSKERDELDAQEKELREEVGKAEEKRRWFGDFKIFIEEVADFLDEKYPALEKIEKDNLAIQRERADIVARRRYADDADDVALFTGSPVPTNYPLPEAGATEMLDVEVSSALEPRSDARSARRADRLVRAASDEGAGTDDELESDQATDLAAAVSDLRERLAKLFEDVKADDFRDPNLGIRARFEQWREQFGEEYHHAFGGLAMVGVWEFWARVEMGLWNPFEIPLLTKSPPGLDAYQWHASLSSYGQPPADADPEAEDESEAVVNLLVTSVVIPRLEKLAATFDPLSRAQTTRALNLLDEVSYCVERSSHKFEALVQAFIRRIQRAMSQAQSLVAPRLEQMKVPAIAMDPSTFDARNRFARRQVRLLQNALRWRRYAKSLRLQSTVNEQGEEELVGAGALFDEAVVRELVAKVILPVVEAGWQTGGSEIAAQVIELMPKDVAPPALVRRLEGERS